VLCSVMMGLSVSVPTMVSTTISIMTVSLLHTLILCHLGRCSEITCSVLLHVQSTLIRCWLVIVLMAWCHRLTRCVLMGLVLLLLLLDTRPKQMRILNLINGIIHFACYTTSLCLDSSTEFHFTLN
jgi:hypothetical protein